ncbi:hypothetical protein NG798_00040 [Ancylothrix sp. C2]|uniref:hypothetical protein n=1 Tax=Ancylothrix sp. D3o TaxID=2953691 RepID=UPI0021BA5CE8|nr:hypothetical protein [Ancylothrix sp. D3o]MCT7948180.1 hypothetical protein [Ancylothrix sp. D3o]
MPFDPISWIIIFAIGFGGGSAINYDWNRIMEDIKAWANRVVGDILDTINKALEVASDAIVYLLKEKNRYYKQVEVYVMNINTNNVKIVIEKEIIEYSEIPEEIRQELEQKMKIKLMKMKT